MIHSIRLQNFRSYRDESFEFDGGVNIVIGPNASGKTNLLEAILYLSEGKSFRARDSELVQFSKDWARLDGFFGSSSRVLKLSYQNGPESFLEKTFVLDDKPYKRLSLSYTVPVVLFEPSHLQLVSRGPDYRREFFDGILERTDASFKKTSASYRRALAQRNALLKQPLASAKRQLFAWNIRLSELGSQIAGARMALIDDINKSISRSYSQIANKRTKVELIYDTPFNTGNYSSKLLSKLEASTPLDFRRGFTAHGPHREDISLILNKKPAGSSASRGETRSLLISLKIYEMKLLEKVREAKPIFLLDDVFSELDGARRRHLVEHLKDHQTIITTTDADAVVEYFAGTHKLISIG